MSDTVDTYDAPWRKTLEFIDQQQADRHKRVLEDFKKANDRVDQTYVFPVLTADDDSYGIVLDASNDKAKSKVPGYQSVRLEGDLPNSYDIEDEITDIENYKR